MSHTTTLWKAIVLSLIISHLVITVCHAATPPTENAARENNDWDAEGEEEFMPSFLHVKKLFNEGKPFFVEKDPVSGQLDFNHKKSAGVVQNYKSPAEELIPLRTNEIAPNIHDFLHLPVKYSSSKSVYPLVSTSYASTKYQGSNKDNTISNNHKEYSSIDIQKRPNFFTANAILPFEKVTTSSVQQTPKTTSPVEVTTRRTLATVTTFKPTLSRRPLRPVPTRFNEPTSYWKRTEFPPSTITTQSTTTTTTTPPTTTTQFTPTVPRTTTVKTTYSPTIPTTTVPTTKKYEAVVATTAEKVPVPLNFIPTTTAVSSPPTTYLSSAPPSQPIATTTKRPLVFPTEPTSVSLMEMLNNFADDSNPNSNLIQINENAQPFQRPSGFRPPPQQRQQQANKDFMVATTTTTSPRPPNQMVNFNDYVKYDIQAPNMVSFHSHEPVSSMNNIKISPDQNVASFVLGSKQSFGGDNGNTQVQPQAPKVVGQVFNEPISGGPVSIRFPSKEEENRFENVPVITGAHKTIPNGHSAPFGFDPTKQRIAFPSRTGSIMANGPESQMSVGTKIVFESDDQVNGNPITLPLMDVLPLKSDPNQRPLSTVQDQGLTPPPAREYSPQSNRMPTRPNFGGFMHRPSENPSRVYDSNLPNILPQTRPNPTNLRPPYPRRPYSSVPEQRYPPRPANRRTYEMPPPQMMYPYQSNRFQSKMAPAPPPPPNKEKIEANRRMYKLPTQPLYAAAPRIHPYANNQHPASDRIFNVRPQPQYPQIYQQQQEPIGGGPMNMESSNRFGQIDPMLALKNNNFIDDNTYKSPPHQEILPSGGDAKLEPVVTLQMIHTKKGGQGTKLSTLHADIPKNGIPTGPPANGTDKPVYVVYPVHEKAAEANNGVVIGQRGGNSPAPPKELNVASGAYQNTPFTVIHHEQQPILTTLQKHLSIPKSPNRTNFPYQLEQPDPNSASELDSKTRRKDNNYPTQESIYNIGEQPTPQNIQPKILNKPGEPISAKLPMITERPAIAIAYTPTTKRPQTAQQQQGGHYNHYSMPNYDSAVIPEILDNHQSTPFVKKDELDVAYPVVGVPVGGIGDYYEKDFQAPFHPSVNLGTISDSYQGWSILDRTTKRTNDLGSDQPQYQTQQQQRPVQQQLQQPQQPKNNINNEIDRKDKNKDELIIGDYTSEAKDPIAHEAGGFHPELEGGFMPIVPAHLMHVDHHDMAMKLDEDIPVAEKHVAARPQEIVMAKDTMVDISAEASEQQPPQMEEAKPIMHVQSASIVVAHHEDLEEEEKPEEQHEDIMQDKEEDYSLRMKEPERKPFEMPQPLVKDTSSGNSDGVSTTTEKVMSLGDALSAIFGLDDEKFDEMTTKSQLNEIEESRSS